VRGFARLLERDFGTPLGETGRRYLRQLLASTEHMRGLVEELLELAVPPKPSGSLGFLAPDRVLDPLAAELEPRLAMRGIHLELPVDPPQVYADATRFYQVASNLISNAIDHMGDPERPEIRVSVDADSEGAVLIVADNGRGVPETDRVRIFDAFTSLSSSPTHRGLGLAIVHRIVAAHGGRVSVHATQPRGATFRATFPNPS
jgi:signal transduction histidine kinase